MGIILYFLASYPLSILILLNFSWNCSWKWKLDRPTCPWFISYSFIMPDYTLLVYSSWVVKFRYKGLVSHWHTFHTQVTLVMFRIKLHFSGIINVMSVILYLYIQFWVNVQTHWHTYQWLQLKISIKLHFSGKKNILWASYFMLMLDKT